MAHLSGTFYSRILCRPVHYTAVLCNDNAYYDSENPHNKRATKSVYLLHGYAGCDTDWLTNAPLQDLANRFNVNFFMPAGENSFYLDRPETGFEYAKYTGEEFVEYTRKTFALSNKREDTFIGGLSMGGFGALHTSFAYPETFSKTIALSSALIHNEVCKMEPGQGNPVANYEYYRAMFGEPGELSTSVNNPEYLISKLLEENKQIPDIYMAIGTEDFLLEPNKEFKAFLDSKNVPVTFVTGPGVHDFNFWRVYLEKGLEWALEGK